MEFRDENQPRQNVSFDVLAPIMKVERDLKQRVKVSPYQGMKFKEGMIFEKTDLDESALLHPDIMMGNLMVAENKPPQEIEMIIGTNVDICINNIVTSCNGIDYSKVFKMPSVLTALRNIFSRIPEPMYSTLVSVNKLIYDTLTDTNNYPEKDQVLEACRNLAAEVNKTKVKELLQINHTGHSQYQLTARMATYLALARFSSFDENTNIVRLNFIMMTSPNSLEIFNEQIIIDIYGVLFNRLGVLFNSIMFDVYDKDDLPWLTDTHNEAISLQVNAVLDIMNTQTIPVISRVLNDYLIQFNQVYGGDLNRTRASLRTLSPVDYDVLFGVINTMELQGIYIP